MFRKRPGTEQPTIPQRRQEDEAGVRETVIATGTRVHGPMQGRNRVHIARLESGNHDPTLGTLQKLAKALKVKVGELLE